jgi:recombination protein RecT
MPDVSATQQTDKGLATVPPNELVKTDLYGQMESFLEILGGDEAKARRIIKITYSAITKNPELLECAKWGRGRASLIQAALDAAEAGLEPSGNLNRASIAPFREKSGDAFPLAKLMIGYEGLADLMRDGPIEDVWAEVVYEGDEFAEIKGASPDLKHVPKHATEDVGKITYFYAIVFFRGGRVHFEVMSRAQVDAVRAMSRSANGPAWMKSYPQMGRKTVLRRLAHYVPLSDRAARGITKDDEREFGTPETVVVTAKPDSLGEQLRAKAGRQKAPEKPQDATKTQDGQSATPDVSATQRTPAVEPVAEKAQPTETVEGEVVCDDESPYEDGARCVLVAKHKTFHKGASGATWGGVK